jgi:hypothetical protein
LSFQRKQFTFYRSFYLAALKLPEKKRAGFVWTLIQYALDEIEPTIRDSTILSNFENIRPILDRARAKAMSGKSGGEASGEARSKIEAKTKQNEAKSKQNEANPKVEIGVEIERDIDLGIGGDIERGQSFPPAENTSLFSEVFDRLRYCEVFLTEQEQADCRRLCGEYGSRAVIEAIERAWDQQVPRWSYIRAIVTSGGVGPRGGNSRRGAARGSYIHHDDAPSPAMLAAVQEMLAEPDDYEMGTEGACTDSSLRSE